MANNNPTGINQYTRGSGKSALRSASKQTRTALARSVKEYRSMLKVNPQKQSVSTVFKRNATARLLSGYTAKVRK